MPRTNANSTVLGLCIVIPAGLAKLADLRARQRNITIAVAAHLHRKILALALLLRIARACAYLLSREFVPSSDLAGRPQL